MGLGYIDALLTISQKLEEALNIRKESYVFQIDFSAAFDSWSHWPELLAQIYTVE